MPVERSGGDCPLPSVTVHSVLNACAKCPSCASVVHRDVPVLLHALLHTSGNICLSLAAFKWAILLTHRSAKKHTKKDSPLVNHYEILQSDYASCVFRKW